MTWRGVTVQNGYVEIYNVMGGPNYVDGWIGYLRYYASYAARTENVDANLPIDDESMTQIMTPYAPGDPYLMLLDQLKKWFPEGVQPK